MMTAKMVLLVLVALFGGMALGVLIRYFLDKNLVQDAWGEWDKIYRKERDAYKDREKRMVAEITRLHKEKAETMPTVNDKKNDDRWMEVLKDTDDVPEWNDIEFGGF